MWSPEDRLAYRGAKSEMESELSLRYLAPGAFTILPPGAEGPPPDLSSTASKHRLTPTTKKHRNAAFSIIAEPGSNPDSRSPSPTGRVSPFRGRGFNPTGSRHASPQPSPPPGGRRISPARPRQQPEASKRSKIPTLSRRGSTATLFGEKVGNAEATTAAAATSHKRTNHQTNLSKQLSQSLNSISPRHVVKKPPPSPRTTGRRPRAPAFQKLSPIAGSSPEPSPDQHRLQPHPQSSPSKIPRSRSQPPSARGVSPHASKTTSRATSRNPSRNASRNASRESSPAKLTTKNNYKNVKAKVNSFSTVKPQVPPKPQVPKKNEKQTLERKQSVVGASPANDNNKSNATTGSGNNNGHNKNNNSGTSNNKDKISGNNNKNNNKSNSKLTNENVLPITTPTRAKASPKDDAEEAEDEKTLSNKESPTKVKTETETSEKEMKKTDSAPKLMDLLQPSTTAVVSSTTTTVTQPLKIEAKFDVTSRDDSDKGDNSMYLPDARALSATSVSTAMNRMNDTVLDTKTLMKESHLSSKLSPAATAIISMSTNENNPQKAGKDAVPDTKTSSSSTTVTTALPPVETVNGTAGSNGNNNNTIVPPSQLTSALGGNNNAPSLNSSKPAIVEVKPAETNGKSAVISPDRGVVGLTDALPKSANERIKEARTMVATDVQPIRITVKEKPSDTEVQSGNVRLPVSATNGLSERPGLPPPQPPPEEPPATPEPAMGVCGRLMACCRKTPKSDVVRHDGEERSKLWCCSRNKKTEDDARRRIDSDTSLVQEEANKKVGWWQKTKCCKRNKVADTGCFPKTQRKDSWAERTDSHTSESQKKSPKDKCKNFFRTIFCLNLCSRKRRKEEEEAMKRRASTMSKKKSLTPPAVPEEPKSKLDAGLVEHTSLMKGAIPVLPVPLAWLCLVLNVFLPGTGTIVSGFLCLCMGKARFSMIDGAKQRMGACIIDFFIGCGQLFTVLFCLVGWGWSIWWGVIMIKIARKYRKIRRAEKAMEEDNPAPAVGESHSTRDPERGS